MSKIENVVYRSRVRIERTSRARPSCSGPVAIGEANWPHWSRASAIRIFDGRRGHSNLQTRLPMVFDRSKFGPRQTDPRGERR
jgi:hypothetical protein